MKGFFSGKAAYYAKYRKGYPAEMFDCITSRLGLMPSSEVLDLGCGTGNMAIPLARQGFHVYAVDPEPEMLAEGKRCERDASVTRPISWLIGADTTIGRMSFPPLRLCTMGLSFHWMDRQTVLRTLDGLIEPGGGIACVDRNDSLFSHLGSGWGCVVYEVLQEMLGDSWDYSGLKHRQMERHENFFLESPFPVLEEYTFPVQEEMTIDSIVGLILSQSYIDLVLLLERNAEFRDRLTRRLLKVEPSGKFTEKFTVHLILATRE